MKRILYYTFILVIALFSGCSAGKNHADNEIHEEVHDQQGPEDHESDGHSDHTLLEIRKKPFAFTIRTGGRILVDSRDVQISKMNGRKISQGKSTGENSFYIPVFFRMDYDPALIEGTFAEVFLIGKEIAEAVVVPNTALMEEYGKLYVFVEDDNGEFSKRYIEAGHDNGEETLVISGLSENDKIVATGSYSIKLSQMVNTAPAHAHSH